MEQPERVTEMLAEVCDGRRDFRGKIENRKIRTGTSPFQ